MQAASSVTAWIEQVKRGDPHAARRIWERYCRSLIALAHRKLAGATRRSSDEEDVVQQAFAAFFQAAQSGRLTLLGDRDDLWALLVKITENKAIDARRKSRSQRRGAGKVRGHSVFEEQVDREVAVGFEAVADPEPTPEAAIAAVDEYRRLLTLLDDKQLQEIVRLRLAGHTQDEIARQLDCVRQTVIRKLELVRTIWSKELAS